MRRATRRRIGRGPPRRSARMDTEEVAESTERGGDEGGPVEGSGGPGRRARPSGFALVLGSEDGVAGQRGDPRVDCGQAGHGGDDVLTRRQFVPALLAPFAWRGRAGDSARPAQEPSDGVGDVVDGHDRPQAAQVVIGQGESRPVADRAVRAVGDVAQRRRLHGGAAHQVTVAVVDLRPRDVPGRHLREGAERQAAGHHVPERDPPGADLIPLTGQRCAPDAAGVAPADSSFQVSVARDKSIADTGGYGREDCRRATGPVSHRQQFCPHSHTGARRLRGWQLVTCTRSLPALDRGIREVGMLAALGDDDRSYVVFLFDQIDSGTSAGRLGVGGDYCRILVTPSASGLAISR
jgi:hypothetical protein